jgi:NodT family efflux transporter outer membrane factor (OMF) lipoprotein
MRNRNTAALCLAIAALGGCASLGSDDAARYSAMAAPERLPSQPAGIGGEEQVLRWWEKLDEPALNQLVDLLVQDNPDLASAQARYRQAEQGLMAERAGFWPQLTGSGSVDRSIGSDQPGGDTTLFQNGLNASWEVDLFGRIRSSNRAAKADLNAAGANVRAQQIALTGSLARSYVDERLARERLSITESLLEAQRQTGQIAEWRVQAGLASGVDREQARQLVFQTEAQLPSLRSNQRNSANRIAVLVGQSPGQVDALLASNAGIPKAIPLAVLTPADVIRRRPDVRAAEEGLASELARIGVARAALLPQLTITGSVGGSATSLGDLLDAVTGSIGALINQTLFDGGRNRANLEAQKARADAALYDYRSTVLAALEDVDNAYDAVAAAERRLVSRRAAEVATANAALYLRQQYRSGLVDFTALLDAERSLLSASDARAQAEADVTRTTITLMQALGGDDPFGPDAGQTTGPNDDE